MLRLVNNLEFLRDTKSQSGVAFSPVTMDLAGLCRHTAEDTAPLLAQAGIQLRYQPSTEGLLIPGDAALLSRMLLGLLSNAAKAGPQRDRPAHPAPLGRPGRPDLYQQRLHS